MKIVSRKLARRGEEGEADCLGQIGDGNNRR